LSTWNPFILHPKENEVYLKETKERKTPYIRMGKDTIGNEDPPIVIEEWKNKVEYWKRALNTSNEIYNDHTIMDGIDSYFEELFPKTQ